MNEKSGQYLDFRFFYFFLCYSVRRNAKYPPSAAFPSPSGGVAPSAPPLVRLRRPFGKPPPLAAVKEWKLNEKKKKLGRHERPIFGAPGPPRSGRQLTPPLAAIKKEKKIWAPSAPQMVDPFHEDSKYVFGFKIGQRKVVSIVNGQNHRRTYHPVRY